MLSFVWIYYAIKTRTVTSVIYQICEPFAIGFNIGFVSVIVNPNVDEESVESLGTIGALIRSTQLFKRGIDQRRIFAKNKLNG